MGCGDSALHRTALPDRQHLHRLTEVWPDAPLYFLTICTADRKPLLTAGDAPGVLLQTWRDAELRHGWRIGRYVIMPDHVHFFARPQSSGAKALPAFIRDWKKWTTREILRMASASGRPLSANRLWQPEFFDHLVRSAESYSAKWDYVRQNPVRAGLTDTPETWPHAGEIHPLSF